MKKVLSVILALILCVLSLLSVDVKTNAAIIYLDAINEGEVWSKNWTGDECSKDVNLIVDETAFYQLSFTDYKLTGTFVIDVYDLTDDTFLCYIDTNNKTVESYTSNEILFYADHTYQLTCTYYELNDYVTVSASISLTFNKATNNIETIPTGTLANSSLQLQLAEDEKDVWLQYTSGTAGDYTLHFEDLYASVYLYESPAFTQVGYYDSVYYSKNNDEWRVKDDIIVTLKANTQYYFKIVPNHNSKTKLSVTRNTKDVIEVILNSPTYTFSCFSDIDAYSFTYKITYTDRTTTEYEFYEDIEREGYDAPIVEYTGEYSEVGYDTYLRAGVQPVNVTYQGNITTYYVQVESLVSWVPDTKIYGANDIFSIKYRYGVEEPAWFRIRVNESGIYTPYRYNEDDFNTNFSYYSLDIVDINNDAAWYSEEYYGWALNAGQEYVLKFDYIYESGFERNTIEFWFEKEANLKNGWSQNGGNWYFYENGIFATGWRYIGTTWYYFNEKGIMQTGWQLIGTTWYYFNASGAMQTGWQYIGANWYFFNSGGAMVTGWMQNGSIWYYFTDGGNMATGWQLVGSTWYYFNAGGAMQTGWQYIGANWYFFNNGGAMVTGWMQNGSIWYYFTDGGNMATGWQLVGSTWYYFNAGGNMATGWLNLGGAWYYLAEGGNMLTDWQQIGYNWYYFNASGVWIPQ